MISNRPYRYVGRTALFHTMPYVHVWWDSPRAQLFHTQMFAKYWLYSTHAYA